MATTETFQSEHTDHDVRRMYRTDGTNTTYLYCLTDGHTHDEVPA